MEKTTFSDGGVAEYQASHFVSAAFDLDKHEALGEKYGVQGVPTSFFVAPDGELLLTVDRPMAIDGYRELLKNVFDGYAELVKARKEPAGEHLVGAAYAKIGNHEKAKPSYEKAVERLEAKADKQEADRRRVAETLSRIADSLIALEGKPEEGRVLADRMAKADPDGAFKTRDNLIFLRAWVAFGDQRNDEMLAGLKEVLEKHPDSDKLEDTMVIYASAMLNLKKDKKAAEALLRSFLEKFPKSSFREQVQHMLQHATGEHGDHD
ncbi:MAG TPA: tetratricopeptide repeat protein [Planctomycetota bacterium]|nr:tetratricopeptide repeat protein [Planctomycetota bacterium]